MFVNENADLYRHLTFASVGGFFGAYAILCRSGILASAQTMNLLELTLNALRGDAVAVLLHLGALVLYVAGTMMTVDRKSTRLNSSHYQQSRMPSSA